MQSRQDREMRLCAIIPSYRHAAKLPEISASLRTHGLSVLIVDDGNDGPIRGAIKALHAPGQGIEVMRLDVNGGKGAAMQAGFKAALERGFTHALQIDADGQHDLSNVAGFIAAAEQHPDALICGRALYDESVPKGRQYGRYITHFWVWVETCSFDIADSMCGFRLYPLAPVAELIKHGRRVGARMDFDTEIAVRLHWRGVPVINLPTRVIYPPDNTSNFDMLRDNVRISLMHTKLVLEALFRLIGKALHRR
jgi:glycosyltransferase involved in cell wall biosynthesis